MSRKRKPIMDVPLPRRAQRFVDLYPITLNATRAAEAAGYSARSAKTLGERLLRDPRVKAAIDKVMAARSKRAKVKADRVIEELEDMALVDVGDLFDFSGDVPRMLPANRIPVQARRAITAIKVRRYPNKENHALDVEIVEFKTAKEGAITTLMRHHGLLVDRVKIDDDVGEAELEERVAAILKRAAERRRAALSGSGS